MMSIKRYLPRIAACVLLFFVYLYGWRPMRKNITQKIIRPQLKHALYKQKGKPYAITSEGLALRITFDWGSHTKTIQYRPQAGFFFLLSLMTIIFIGIRWRWTFILVGLHAASTLLTALLMLVSKEGWLPGFILVDLIGTYLVPVMTLALAAWAVAWKNGMIDFRSDQVRA